MTHRPCSKTTPHETHTYWTNRHGDDAYDEGWRCPGVPFADDEERRQNARAHREQSAVRLANAAQLALIELDNLARFSSALWPDERLTLDSARSLCERLGGLV